MSDSADHVLLLLRALRETGPEGFEGLICRLMEEWTGERFYLCASGRQAGRDLSTAGAGRNWIAVECKRYGEKTPMKEREVLGEISQVARRIEGLDLWVLVSSTEITEQFAAEIYDEAKQRGLSVLLLDTRPGSGLLTSFIARFPDTVAAHLELAGVDFDANALARALETIRNEAGADGRTLLLSRALGDLIGYDGVRRRTAAWLKHQVSDTQRSMIAFAQKLDVRVDAGTRTVRRRQLHQGLDQWLSTWAATSPAITVLGDEGSGKTWACVDWVLARQGTDPDFPITAVVTSNLVDAVADPEQLIARALGAALPGVLSSLLQRRVRTWAGRADRGPMLLLVLDGINERPRFDWLGLLRQLSQEPWKGHVATLITSREGFYERNLLRFEELGSSLSVAGYTDEELAIALTESGLTLQQIPASLHPLIRKPRYCDLVVAHFDRLTATNDLTVERLVYEDWQDRRRRKHSTPIDDTTFRQVLAAAAGRARADRNSFSQREIEALLPSSLASLEALEELTGGGVFVGSGSDAKPYRVDRRLLVHGLGLLLFEELVAADEVSADLGEELSRWLEPHEGMDLKLEIVGAAVFYAAIREGSPAGVRRELLRMWITGRNLSESAEEAILAYFARMPDLYLEVADSIWGARPGNSAAKARVAEAIVEHIESDSARLRLVPAVERWPGTVHLQGHPFYSRREGKEHEAALEELRTILGKEPGVGTFCSGSFELRIVDEDNAAQLVRLALLVISAGKRQPFTRALIKWALAWSVMDVPLAFDDTVEWVVRLTDEDLTTPIAIAVEDLCSSPNETNQKAAFRLLRAIGSVEANPRSAQMRAQLYPEEDVWRRIREDPCEYIVQWSRSDCDTCMSRADLEPKWIARQVKRYAVDPSFSLVEGFQNRLPELASGIDLDRLMCSYGQTDADVRFDDAEPVLAAFAPDRLGGLVRDVVRRGAGRSGVALKRLAHHAPEFVLVLGPAELQVVAEARQKVISTATGWADFKGGYIPEDISTEMHLFAVEVAHLGAAAQLRSLVERPEHAYQMTNLEHWFKPLADELARSTLLALREAPLVEQFRTLWFLRLNPAALDEAHREVLVGFGCSPDMSVRVQALEWISTGEDTALIQLMASRLGPEPADPQSEERRWHRWTRIRAAATNAEIRGTLSLCDRVAAAAATQWATGEAGGLADELHAEWTSWRASNSQQGCPHAWNQVRFHAVDLLALIRARPAYACDWAQWATRAIRESNRWSHFARSFYVALEAALLVLQPALGAGLWMALREHGTLEIDGPLSATGSQEVEWLRAICIEDAFTDAEISSFTRMAEARGQGAWLRRTAASLLDSVSTWRRGRGIALAALGDFTSEDFEPFAQALAADRSWLQWRRQDLIKWHEQNLWARRGGPHRPDHRSPSLR